ncbi:hypothetical protein [Rhodococcus sp. 077-4]|uniref:hypothetical protein n=1 Tax=Rhodococcus sp. 077-4 TaxID=2789271 RepID=UPI0039F5C7DA
MRISVRRGGVRIDGVPVGDRSQSNIVVKPSGTRVDVQIASAATVVDRSVLQGIALAAAGSID